MTQMICRACGAPIALRSRFEDACTECGSDDLEEIDAYDPVEYELRCQFCGYSIDTAARDDSDGGADDDRVPTSVDDPCPICGSSLVPLGDAPDIRQTPAYAVARGAARKAHREHALPGPPYELDNLARELGLTIDVGEHRHDGMLVDTTIEIPATTTRPVRRFVVAHEIGHFVLGHDGERSKSEPEANAFASELLIPRDELLESIRATPSMRVLGARFGVSRQAMVYAVMAANAIARVRA